MHIDAPFELVLFGGLGDLSLRKLLPALYMLDRDKRLPEGAIYAVTRQVIERDAFKNQIESALKSHIKAEFLELSVMDAFVDKVHCLTMNVIENDDYENLKKVLSNDCANRLFYMATGSNL
ncbi:MAG: glucose-6-phosphate dehydrogenase, partial [Oleibacter sp.]|nr:glucose-6-phosphate dehydrogenase [Thalassolituus sp.]